MSQSPSTLHVAWTAYAAPLLRLAVLYTDVRHRSWKPHCPRPRTRIHPEEKEEREARPPPYTSYPNVRTPLRTRIGFKSLLYRVPQLQGLPTNEVA